jgi:hypothetical protein
MNQVVSHWEYKTLLTIVDLLDLFTNRSIRNKVELDSIT